jgi:predicted HD phosphohydrolase
MSTIINPSIQSNVEELFLVLSAAREIGYIGEPVSQLSHALQAAHYAAQLPNSNNQLVIAALLHDIGHICMEKYKAKNSKNMVR